MDERQLVQFVSNCRKTHSSWPAIAKALMILDVTPQQLYAGRMPSLDDCDTIHNTLLMRWATRHGIT